MSAEYRRALMEIWEADQKQVIEEEKLVLRLRDEGETYRKIRDQTELGLATIRRIIADNEKVEVGIK